jgi:hypothetical protein
VASRASAGMTWVRVRVRVRVPLPDVVAMQTRQANLEGAGEIPLRGR